MKNGFWLVLLALVSVLQANPRLIQPTKSHPGSFAIIIDSTSFARTEKAVYAYRQSIEEDGLSAYILINDWQSADEVRSQIIDLRSNDEDLEGFVLVGDIPIPMIRDGQHLTSAFKIDQRNKRYSTVRTSVPSDRFYDDLDLRFTFVEQDSANPLLFYYRLSPDSPQKIDSDLYSARLKPPVDDDTKYTRLNENLLRIAAQKKIHHKLDKAFVFAGHGYHSEALDAWVSEIQAMREIFPDLYLPGRYLKNYYHEMSAELKEIMIHELQNSDIDLGIFHAHGGDDVQYLLGIDPASTIGDHVEAIKKFLRSKLRQAKRRKRSLEETQKYYQGSHNIPDDWFEGAFSDSLLLADSLWAAKQDLYAEDVQKITPQAKVLYLDECYNGAFIRTPYQAGEYIFNKKGNTLAVLANSVNVLQDLWANEHLGLFAQGIRIGQWNQFKNYLESHVFGDPTFRFQSKEITDLTTFLHENDPEDLVESHTVALRALGVAKLQFEDKRELIKILSKIATSDPAGIVRLQALKHLMILQPEDMTTILLKSASDPYELIRRFTAIWLGDMGKPEHLPVLMQQMVYDLSTRVRFNAKKAIEKIGTDKRITDFEKVIAPMRESQYKSDLRKRSMRSFNRSDEWLNDELLIRLRDKDLPLKKRLSATRTFRNYRFHQAVPELITIMSDPEQEVLIRAGLAEALGWYSLSYNKGIILASMDALLQNEDTPDSLRAVCMMTRNRLLAGPNNIMTP